MTHTQNDTKGLRRRIGLVTAAAFAFIALSSFSAPVMAQEWHGQGHDDHGRGHEEYRHEEYHPDVRHGPAPHYRYADNVWHRGRWVQGFHDGRRGWWWMVNGAWFYYPQPVYPYPVNPYAPQEVYTPPVIAPPPPPPSEGFTLVVPLHIH